MRSFLFILVFNLVLPLSASAIEFGEIKAALSSKMCPGSAAIVRDLDYTDCKPLATVNERLACQDRIDHINRDFISPYNDKVRLCNSKRTSSDFPSQQGVRPLGGKSSDFAARLREAESRASEADEKLKRSREAILRQEAVQKSRVEAKSKADWEKNEAEAKAYREAVSNPEAEAEYAEQEAEYNRRQQQLSQQNEANKREKVNRFFRDLANIAAAGLNGYAAGQRNGGYNQPVPTYVPPRPTYNPPAVTYNPTPTVNSPAGGARQCPNGFVRGKCEAVQ